MTGTTSEFGVQFDSLADVVSFGVALRSWPTPGRAQPCPGKTPSPSSKSAKWADFAASFS